MTGAAGSRPIARTSPESIALAIWRAQGPLAMNEIIAAIGLDLHKSSKEVLRRVAVTLTDMVELGRLIEHDGRWELGPIERLQWSIVHIGNELAALRCDVAALRERIK